MRRVNVKRIISMIVILVITLISISNISSEESYVSFDYENISYTINLEKDVFKVGETININNIIHNKGKEVIGIEVAEYSHLNFDFTLYKLNGRLVEKSMSFYETKERMIEDIDEPRSETLYPNEQYGMEVNFDYYYENLEPGRYIIEPKFFPLTNIGEYFPTINGKKIQIQIVSIPYNDINDKNNDDNDKTQIEALSPYDTIDRVLASKIKEDWDVFFSYIDLKRIIVLYNDWYERLLKLPKSKQDSLIEEFKSYFKKNFEDDMLDYQIIRSIRETNTAKVVAEIYKGEKRIKLTSRYVFELEKRNEYWIITSYEIMNLGR